MSTARIFSHGGSQAVRLPKEFRFDCSEVHVRRVGQDVVLSPKPPASAEALLEALDAFDPSAPLQREQPPQQKRAAIKPRR
jgi:antitoxin VapB